MLLINHFIHKTHRISGWLQGLFIDEWIPDEPRHMMQFHNDESTNFSTSYLSGGRSRITQYDHDKLHGIAYDINKNRATYVTPFVRGQQHGAVIEISMRMKPMRVVQITYYNYQSKYRLIGFFDGVMYLIANYLYDNLHGIYIKLSTVARDGVYEPRIIRYYLHNKPHGACIQFNYYSSIGYIAQYSAGSLHGLLLQWNCELLKTECSIYINGKCEWQHEYNFTVNHILRYPFLLKILDSELIDKKWKPESDYANQSDDESNQSSDESNRSSDESNQSDDESNQSSDESNQSSDE